MRQGREGAEDMESNPVVQLDVFVINNHSMQYCSAANQIALLEIHESRRSAFYCLPVLRFATHAESCTVIWAAFALCRDYVIFWGSCWSTDLWPAANYNNYAEDHSA